MRHEIFELDPIKIIVSKQTNKIYTLNVKL